MKISKNIRNAVALTSLFVALTSCQLENEQNINNITLSEKLHEIDNGIPSVQDNQKLIIHSAHIKPGYKSFHELEYTLLTNLDDNVRTWEVAEKVYQDANYNRADTVFFQEGYSPAQSLPMNKKVEYVGSDFFEQYK